MAKKRKATPKRTHSTSSHHEKMSPVIQFAIVFIFVAAIALAALVGKNFL